MKSNVEHGRESMAGVRWSRFRPQGALFRLFWFACSRTSRSLFLRLQEMKSRICIDLDLDHP
eukprot:scaffold14173_cov110-Skeletonema_dohrnii-CCMP3373.AAC.7